MITRPKILQPQTAPVALTLLANLSHQLLALARNIFQESGRGTTIRPGIRCLRVRDYIMEENLKTLRFSLHHSSRGEVLASRLDETGTLEAAVKPEDLDKLQHYWHQQRQQDRSRELER